VSLIFGNIIRLTLTWIQKVPFGNFFIVCESVSVFALLSCSLCSVKLHVVLYLSK